MAPKSVEATRSSLARTPLDLLEKGGFSFAFSVDIRVILGVYRGDIGIMEK